MDSAQHFDSNRAVWLGVAFSLAFVALIWLTGELWLDPPPFAERKDAAWLPVLWYYWQLAEPDFWTRFSAWSLYALHQLGLWGLIAWAQIRRPGYTATLHPVNIIAIAFNLSKLK